jgi:hypothetical protein
MVRNFMVGGMGAGTRSGRENDSQRWLQGVADEKPGFQTQNFRTTRGLSKLF